MVMHLLGNAPRKTRGIADLAQLSHESSANGQDHEQWPVLRKAGSG